MDFIEAKEMDYYGEPKRVNDENGFQVAWLLTLTEVDDYGNFYFYEKEVADTTKGEIPRC